MKKTVFIILLVVLSHPRLAGAGFDLPVLKDRAELYLENIKIQEQLEQQYGKASFFQCLNCPLNELKNPYSHFKCLEQTRRCLNNQALPKLDCGPQKYQIGRSCVSADFACKADFGPGAYFNGQMDGSNYVCGCGTNYSWNNTGTYCEPAACPENMIYYSPYLDRHGVYLNGRCYGQDEICRTQFGENSLFKEYNQYGQIVCACGNSQEYNSQSGACEDQVVVLGFDSEEDPDFLDQQFINTEIDKLSVPDPEMIERLKGKILLQAEKKGEAWYMDPTTGFRHYLSRPAKAFGIMREFGLGVKHDIIQNKSFGGLAGRILIDVEDLGKAYYIDPDDNRAHYLGRPDDAFRIMRELGLGISNSDIRKLPIGD